MPRVPKTEFLQIRLTPADRDRVWRVAAAEHLDPSTWARRILLQAAGIWESEHQSPATPTDPTEQAASSNL